MNLPASGREFYALRITTTPSVTGWEASFDGGDTYVAGVEDDGVTRWLVAGPDADEGDAVAVIPAAGVRPRVRVEDDPEIIVRTAPRIYVATV